MARLGSLAWLVAVSAGAGAGAGGEIPGREASCLAAVGGAGPFDPVCAGGATFHSYAAARCAGAISPGRWAAGACGRALAAADGAAAADAHAEHDENGNDYLVVLFIGYGLLLGVATRFVIARFAPSVPYTLALFALGMGAQRVPASRGRLPSTGKAERDAPAGRTVDRPPAPVGGSTSARRRRRTRSAR